MKKYLITIVVFITLIVNVLIAAAETPLDETLIEKRTARNSSSSIYYKIGISWKIDGRDENTGNQGGHGFYIKGKLEKSNQYFEIDDFRYLKKLELFSLQLMPLLAVSAVPIE